MPKAVSKPKGGRPTKFSPEIITKLMAAFANSFTVEEACWYAEISKDTFYKWIEKHPDFSDKMAAAKSAPNMKAKQVIVGSVNAGDVESAKWWLIRKASDEFGSSGNTININFNNHAAEQRERYKLA